MELPASPVRHSSHLKFIVALLGSLSIIVLCLPSAGKLILYYQVMSMARRFPIQSYSVQDSQLLYSPDLAHLVAIDKQTGKAIIWDYATQRITQHINLGPAAWRVAAWSPDQRYLFYDEKDKFDLWDLSEQKKVFSVTIENDDDLYGASYQKAIWSPDNTRIALISSTELTLRDAATGRVLARYQLNGNDVLFETVAAWSPDSKRIAFGGDTGASPDMAHVRVLDASTMGIVSQAGMPIASTAPGGTPLSGNIEMAWSPDGASIAASFGEQLWVFNPSNGGTISSFNDQYDSAWIGPLAWSPDSRQFAFFGSYEKPLEEELVIWRVTDLQKVQVIERGGLSDPVIKLYWPPKTQHIRVITSSGSQENLPLSGW